MRVGFVYNVRSAAAAGEGDEDAEFDEPETIEAVTNALAAHGHDVIGLEADKTLPAALIAAGVDVVFNIAEGKGNRGRESQVPALLELLGIPYTGSDAVTLGITLDKPLASTLVRAAGVATPRGFVLTAADEPLPDGVALPRHRQAGARGIVERHLERLDRARRGRASASRRLRRGDAVPATRACARST